MMQGFQHAKLGQVAGQEKDRPLQANPCNLVFLVVSAALVIMAACFVYMTGFAVDPLLHWIQGGQTS